MAAMNFDPGFIVGRAINNDTKKLLGSSIQAKLTEIMGISVDTILVEYIFVMIGNRKSMRDISASLVDFTGEESAMTFTSWLYQTLTSGVSASEDVRMTDIASEKTTTTVSTSGGSNETVDLALDASARSGLHGGNHRTNRWDEEKHKLEDNGERKGLERKSDRRGRDSHRNDSSKIRKLPASIPGRRSDLRETLKSKRERTKGSTGKPYSREISAKEDLRRLLRPKRRIAGMRSETSSRSPVKVQAVPIWHKKRPALLLGPPVNDEQSLMEAREAVVKSIRKRVKRDSFFPRSSNPQSSSLGSSHCESSSGSAFDTPGHQESTHNNHHYVEKYPGHSIQQRPPSPRPIQPFRNKTWINPAAAPRKREDTAVSDTLGPSLLCPHRRVRPPSQMQCLYGKHRGRTQYKNKTWTRPGASSTDDGNSTLSSSLPKTPPLEDQPS